MITRDLIVKSAIAALLTAAAVGFAAGPALAHTPYIVPVTFAPDRDWVGVQGGMSEEAAFVPDFAIRGAGDWVVTGPDGVQTRAAPTTLKSANMLDAALPTEGTYRISTGERPGRAGKAAKVGGVWRAVRPAPAAGAPAGPARPMEDDAGGGAGPINAVDVPAGAEIMDTQSYLIAETYVSRGAPTPGALKPVGRGLELEPITHPNEIYLDDGFTFRVTVDGKPASGLRVTAYRGGETYDGERTAIEATTDADGKASLGFAKAGAYLLETHYPDAPPASAAPASKTWVYTLSFEVTP
ncbi:MAG: DUF4198 domain-containing protein [Caulobacter sp.]|nr:DUF4198 domain-containing protein [Caulobacter sp.]